MSDTLFGGGAKSDALISDDGRYRYWLTRSWGSDGPHATFIMLNPSTADAATDDPTIRRCVGFAKSWGCVGLNVVNLYALRSTDPKGLWLADDPVGPECDRYLTSFAATAAHFGTPLVAAWGANAKPARVEAVLRLKGMQALTALGVTKDGAPRHPLYLRADSTRSPWPSLIDSRASVPGSEPNGHGRRADGADSTCAPTQRPRPTPHLIHP